MQVPYPNNISNSRRFDIFKYVEIFMTMCLVRLRCVWRRYRERVPSCVKFFFFFVAQYLIVFYERGREGGQSGSIDRKAAVFT